jgi:hypothetical protein
MVHPVAAMKRRWRSFARAEPGQRFMEHYRRAQQQSSIAIRVLKVGLGVALTAVGVLLLVLPGPGLLFGVFGMAMFAGESRLLAGFLDRAELFLRDRLRRLRLWWRAVSPTP